MYWKYSVNQYKQPEDPNKERKITGLDSEIFLILTSLGTIWPEFWDCTWFISMARKEIGTEYFHATDMATVEVPQDKLHNGGWFG